MYTNYAYGVKNQTGTPSGNYNLFVTGTNDYTGSTGFMIKNDITQSGPNKKGTRIFQNSDDNAFLDFRTTATDGAKSLAFRLQDDSAPSSVSNMLTLNKDTVSDSSVYGASVAGRVKASQFYINQPDVRAPLTAGVYIGQNNATTGYFNINKGTGSGGFNFQTFNADGTTNKTNLSLKGSGSVQIPYYSTVTTDSQDSETTAMVAFDSTGNMVRSYNQNQRFRGVETRLNNLEGTVLASVPVKVNEIIGRLNTLKIWNTKITGLSLSAPPAPFNPSPVTATEAVQVQLALSVTLTTAQDPAWQTSFINAVAANLGISPSRIVISSVSLTATVYSTSFNQLTLQKAYKGAADGAVYVNVVVNPDPAGASPITPALAASTIIAKAQDPSSDLAVAVASTGAVVDTRYVPAQKPSATVTPGPTTPAPTTPAPTTPAPTTPAPTTPAPTTPAPTTPAPTTPAPTTPAPTQPPIVQSNAYGEWIQIKFPFDAPANKYQMASRPTFASRMIQSWIVAGSNDGTTWYLLDQQYNQTTWPDNTAVTYNLSYPGTYSYYRLIITKVNSLSIHCNLSLFCMYNNNTACIDKYPLTDLSSADANNAVWTYNNGMTAITSYSWFNSTYVIMNGFNAYAWVFTSNDHTYSAADNRSLEFNYSSSTEYNSAGSYIASSGTTTVLNLTSSLSLYDFSSFTFTSNGKNGKTGPTSLTYNMTLFPWADNYIKLAAGIQRWVVPKSGTYTIIAAGAQGGYSKEGYAGGRGVVVSTTVSLTINDTIYILVGQKGGNAATHPTEPGGAGGGTYIVKYLGGTSVSASYPINQASSYQILLIAGGGGGGCALNSQDGLATTTGGVVASAALPGGSTLWSTPATNGAGGGNGNLNSTGAPYGSSAGGAGFIGNGQNTTNTDYSYNVSTSGKSFIYGGEGGSGSSDANNDNYGGFGGGAGSGKIGSWGVGGGGGYSGGAGGGGNQAIWEWQNTGGGGGGSYDINGASNNATAIGYNNGHGYATISLPITTNTGTASVFAGNGTLSSGQSGYVDAVGTAAKFADIIYLDTDLNGNVYVSDLGNQKIRKITPNGTVSTFTSGSWWNPQGVLFDMIRNVLYIADTNNNRIQKISLADSSVTSLTANWLNGVGTPYINNMAIDQNGTLYANDMNAGKIYKVDPTNGAGTLYASGMGMNSGMVCDKNNIVYVCSSDRHCIYQVLNGVSTVYAGVNGTSGSTNGNRTSATFNQPSGIAIDFFGNLYVADSVNNMIRKITPSGTVSTVVSGLNYPYGICVDKNNIIYVSNRSAKNIVKIV